MTKTNHFFLTLLHLIPFGNLAFGQTIFKEVAEGEKPFMTLIENEPKISFVKESGTDSGLYLATFLDPNFEIETISDKYFAGPGILDSNCIVLHEHNLKFGAASVYYHDGDWYNEDASNEGHDGWDADVKFISGDDIRVSYLDAKEFDGVGIEYSRFNGIDWSIDTVGTSQIHYGFRTSLQINSSDEPIIFYHNTTSGKLERAWKNEGTWEIDTINPTGKTGLYNQSQIRNDSIFLTYIEQLNDTAKILFTCIPPIGEVKTITIDTLYRFEFANNGILPVSISVTDSIKLLASNRTELNLYTASLTDLTFDKRNIIKVNGIDSALTYSNSIKKDNFGRTHFTIGLKTTESKVLYGRYPNLNSITEIEKNEIEVFPNPTHSVLNITGTLKEAILLNSGGQVILSTKAKQIDLSNLSKGVYFLKTNQTTHKIIKI